MEQWLNVVSHEGKYATRYQVSDLGRVRAHPDAKIKGMKAGRVLYQSTDDGGYRQVFLWLDRKQTTFKVHRLVADAFIGERSGKQINHISGDKTDNRLENLELVTALENIRHAHRVIEGRSHVVFEGKKYSLPELCEMHGVEGVTPKAASRRIYRLGWSVKDAIKTPKQKTGRPTNAEIAARSVS